jgi:hypothetical protein
MRLTKHMKVAYVPIQTRKCHIVVVPRKRTFPCKSGTLGLCEVAMAYDILLIKLKNV